MLNPLRSWVRTLWLLSPIPVLAFNLVAFTPHQISDAALEEPRGSVTYEATSEESENMRVYQLNSPAVVSINTGQNQGAGVILSPDGLMVTNKHVIQDSQEIEVKMYNGRKFRANLVSMGGFNKDLAFLKIQADSVTNFPFVKMGDSSKVNVGQRVFAIGSPFGLDGTMTIGIISRIDSQRNMLQTDAAINPGNSGGALLNRYGELVGINRSIINPVGASSAGISFAVPINVVKQEIASLGLGPSVAMAR